MDWSCKIKFTLADVLQLQLDVVTYADKLWTIDRFKALTHRKRNRKYIKNSCPGDIYNCQTGARDVLKKNINIENIFRWVLGKKNLTLIIRKSKLYGAINARTYFLDIFYSEFITDYKKYFFAMKNKKKKHNQDE